jgi:hypothetical protein
MAGVQIPTGERDLFFTASKRALGPTQSPIQWAQGLLSKGVKRPEREADHTPTQVPRSRMVELYLHSPIRCHGVVLSNRSVGLSD